MNINICKWIKRETKLKTIITVIPSYKTKLDSLIVQYRVWFLFCWKLLARSFWYIILNNSQENCLNLFFRNKNKLTANVIFFISASLKLSDHSGIIEQEKIQPKLSLSSPYELGCVLPGERGRSFSKFKLGLVQIQEHLKQLIAQCLFINCI